MRNQGTILGVAISLLVISAVFIYVVYAYIPNKEAKIQNTYESLYTPRGVFVVGTEEGLDEGTLITNELFEDGSIELVTIPQNYIPHSLIDSTLPDTASNRKYLVLYTNGEPNASDRNQVIGKVLATRLEQGMMISEKSLGQEEILDIDHTKRDIQIKVENDGGELLKAGKFVDIIVKYKNGGYDIVIPKKYVDKILVSTTQAAETTNTTNEANIQISVDEREYRDYELARRLGGIAVRIYSDNNQYAALKTFNYEAYTEMINKLILEEELTGEHKEYYTELSMLVDEQKKDIVLDTEYYIKLQEYTDTYYKKIENNILHKTITDEAFLNEEMIINAISEYLISASVDTTNMTDDQLLNYTFTDVERKQIVEKIYNYTDEERINIIVKRAKQELNGYSIDRLLELSTSKNQTNMRATLLTEAPGVTEADKKVKAINDLSNDALINLLYATDTQDVQTIKTRINNSYNEDQITLEDLSYIAGIEKSDVVISLIMGNKYIQNAEGLNRAQIYNKYTASYNSTLGTRRVVADKIVEEVLLFYQTYGAKIDSMAYLIQNNLYYQYIK